MDRIALEHPDLVRHVIAGEWLRAADVPARLGGVTLRKHQLEAVRRLHSLLADSGGALLCDDVGLGKTYVALALARSFSRPIVVAPASLRDMWIEAAHRARVAILFVSLEALGRNGARPSGHDVVIVDEAHHFRNPNTARYQSLACLTARSPVLLLSATPLHNAPADISSLLALFLGTTARTLSEADIARYVVRRRQSDLDITVPGVRQAAHLVVPDDIRHMQLLLSLPPPVPAKDGGIAAAMTAHALVRLWASSDAALREGLRRRLAKAVAIRVALEAGRYPTRKELHAWNYGDGAVQLGFAQMLSSETCNDRGELVDAVAAHERALAQVLAALPRDSGTDAARLDHIRTVRATHPEAKIVAFSQFAETVTMYYRGLARTRGVAMLTSRGARIASGAITLSEVLARFAPIASRTARPAPAGDISLLLTTDLLSEGVNLQDACVVVHLDLPWTAASLEQRVGRVARLGSRHRQIFVYAIDPPAPSRDLVRAEAIIRRKAALAEASVGGSRIPPLFARTAPPVRSEIEDAEALRRTLSAWIASIEPVKESRVICATVTAQRDALLALATVHGRPTLIAEDDTGITAALRSVRETIEISHGDPLTTSATDGSAAVERIRHWLENQHASNDAGRPRAGRNILVRRLSTRLALDLARWPRHERAGYSERIAAVHRRMQASFTLGIEHEIEELLRSEKAWDFLSGLEQIIGTRQPEPTERASEIRGVLILKRAAAPCSD